MQVREETVATRKLLSTSRQCRPTHLADLVGQDTERVYDGVALRAEPDAVLTQR